MYLKPQGVILRIFLSEYKKKLKLKIESYWVELCKNLIFWKNFVSMFSIWKCNKKFLRILGPLEKYARGLKKKKKILKKDGIYDENDFYNVLRWEVQKILQM